MTTLRYRSFDALKGLMILIVVLHHSLFVKGMHHGYLAVDMFFWIAGVFLMRDFLKKEQTTVQYTYRRLRKASPPYLLSFGLAAVLDYKHLASFTDFDSFIEVFSPFVSFLTLTEEMGPPLHSYVILVGGWFLSVLIIGGFLLYSLLEYNRRLATKVLLPVMFILGYTFVFQVSPEVENFSKLGCFSFPLLRGFLGMCGGAMVYALSAAYPELLNKNGRLINVAAILAFVFFLSIMFTQKSFDAQLVILIPLVLLGLLISGSWAEKCYKRIPFGGVLPRLGEISLEIFLIHSPVIHIVHSCLKNLPIAFSPALYVLADVLAVIVAAVLLHRVCNKWFSVRKDGHIFNSK